MNLAPRSWAAASPSVVKDWISESTSINQDLREQSAALRARARDLEQNNDYAHKYLNLVEIGVLGDNGISLQCRARTTRNRLDDRVNRLVEREFDKWGRRDCTLDGRLNWSEIQKLAIRSVARDGEILFRLVRGGGLKLVAYDASWLDNELNQDAKNGQNQIIQGIEIGAMGEPVAYHLTKGDPIDNKVGLFGVVDRRRKEYERVPARDMIHLFQTQRPNQVRGASWMAPAMIHLLMLHRYERAEMLAAEFAAKKVGYYKTPTGDWLEGDADAKDYGLPEAINGLGMTELPEGVDMALLDPNHPVQAYAEYVASCLRGIASALGVTYHALSGDLTGVSFSSIRSGTIEERDRWRATQQWMIHKFHQKIFEAWLDENLERLPGLSINDKDRVAECNWQTRGWTWVDPVKDMQSQQMQYQMGVCSLSDIASSQGRDLEEVFDQRQKETELASRYGVSIQDISTELMEVTDEED